MGYDSGILENEHAPSMPFRKSYVHWNPAWRAATDPSSWLKHSVLWYAQQVASRLGAARFQGYVTSFDYGNRDVSGDPGKDNGLALSWVSSSLKISPAEQVTFLRKVVNRQLPLAPKAYDMTARIMQPEMLDNGWEIHGKTGTASPVLPDGRDDPGSPVRLVRRLGQQGAAHDRVRPHGARAQARRLRRRPGQGSLPARPANAADHTLTASAPHKTP